jgi:hypothetical protein
MICIGPKKEKEEAGQISKTANLIICIVHLNINKVDESKMGMCVEHAEKYRM